MYSYQIEKHKLGTKENIHLVTLYLDPAASTALDIGCNEGVLSCHLENLGLQVDAFEQNSDYANSAKTFMSSNYNNYNLNV